MEDNSQDTNPELNQALQQLQTLPQRGKDAILTNLYRSWIKEHPGQPVTKWPDDNPPFDIGYDSETFPSTKIYFFDQSGTAIRTPHPPGTLPALSSQQPNSPPITKSELIGVL
jgi:hypothetical protein